MPLPAPGPVLVLGGYGGFGGRVSRRLAAAGYDVIVAGRSLDRARAFCNGQNRLTPFALDRADLASVLATLRPSIVIDASGPFQGESYAVPSACIAAGISYVDLADARDFVGGIGALDAAAKAAGVVAVTGASSVPALSGAVARALAHGMEHVSAVEMAISASNRATWGPSVAAAILAGVGRPVRLWRGGRWRRGFGWHDMRRETFGVSGTAPLEGRLVALADVPDLDLLPRRLPGGPAVTFRAGTELALPMMALWLAGRLARWWPGMNLRAVAPLHPLQRLMSPFGTDRSAMRVRVFGLADGHAVERRWTLIAERGDGPDIPALAAPLLVDRILAGRIAAGARDAGDALALADFEPAFASLAVRHERAETALPPPLYAAVMGPRFRRLPPALQALHTPLRDFGAEGRARVTGGETQLARLFSRVIGFPAAGEHDLHVHFAADGDGEIWTRTFSGRPFRSRLSQRGPWLVERFGALRFAFDLESDAHGLSMAMQAWWLGPLRLPLALAPRSPAREWQEGERFCFDVPITVPGLGLLVHYRGWLVPCGAAR